ncbi:high-temperature-induced dauer-formation protein-domain-containing protein [Lipomyces japonicus]|uniref:high-temperature-induced dauer-formation protein-domain-containing protein n=1 Tax=Lipomyces japonicus TaxID=56871 RepID=UPI0034CFE3AA
MGAASSKLSFKQSVFRLFEESEIPANDPFWNQFWEVPESSDDIFTLFSSTDVRRTRDIAIKNLERLIVLVISRLVYLLRHSQLHYSPVVAANTASQNGLGQVNRNGLTATQATKQTLNCIRIVTRVLPFIYEKQELHEWESNLFWGNDFSSIATENEKDEDDDDRPLGAALIDTLTDFLFLPGFAIPLVQGRDNGVAYTIWETGIGSTTLVGTNNQFESNKIEILRALLVIVSKAMYKSAQILPVKGVTFTSYIVCNPDKRVVLGVLCSLLNTAMKYNPGWKVPYNHVVFSDPRQVLVTYALQFLVVLITYTIPEDENIVALGINIDNVYEHGPADYEVRRHLRNQYRYYLARLHRLPDLQFLSDGISRMLNQPMEANSSYLPGSQRQIEWTTELVLLSWELLRQNIRFRNFVISSDRVHDFVIHLLYYADYYRLDPAKIGLVRLCIYILLTISTDSVFSVRLNRPFDSHSSLPACMRISGWESLGGTYGDYLLLSIYGFIFSSKGRLTGLYPTLLDIQTNIAPHISNISRLTCSRLINVFALFSQPLFLVASDINFNFVNKILQAINGMIANNNHQSNANLLYYIFRYRNKFEELRNLTFEHCMEEVRLQRRAIMRTADVKDEVVIVLDNDDDHSNGPQGPSILSSPSARKGKGKAAALETDQNSPSNSTSASNENAKTDGGFVPTQSWFTLKHSSLPLSLIDYLLDSLPGHIPKLSSMATFRTSGSSSASSSSSPNRRAADNIEAEVLSAFRHLDDDLIIPESYSRSFQEPINFEWTVASKSWCLSVLWGAIYVSHDSSFEVGGGVPGIAGGTSAIAGASGGGGMWRGTSIALFKVQETKAQGPSLLSPRGAVDAVAKSVLDRIGGNATTPQTNPVST